jgi:hypothetical protein
MAETFWTLPYKTDGSCCTTCNNPPSCALCDSSVPVDLGCYTVWRKSATCCTINGSNCTATDYGYFGGYSTVGASPLSVLVYAGCTTSLPYASTTCSGCVCNIVTLMSSCTDGTSQCNNTCACLARLLDNGGSGSGVNPIGAKTYTGPAYNVNTCCAGDVETAITSSWSRGIPCGFSSGLGPPPNCSGTTTAWVLGSTSMSVVNNKCNYF